MKFDIDWKKMGHIEPRPVKTTYPQNGLGISHPKIKEDSEKKAILDIPPKPSVDKTFRAVEALVPNKPVNISHSEDPAFDEIPAGPRRADNNEENVFVNDFEADEMITSKIENQMSDTAAGAAVAEPQKSEKKIFGTRRVEKLREEKSPSPSSSARGRRGKDLSSGLELIDVDFLLDVVENTKSDETKDVTMRKFAFQDLMRRNKIHELDSTALKIYALNEGDLYGKDIQFEAFKELAERTS
jgi:hypothetical protein